MRYGLAVRVYGLGEAPDIAYVLRGRRRRGFEYPQAMQAKEMLEQIHRGALQSGPVDYGLSLQVVPVA